MLKINKKLEYALMVLKHMLQHQQNEPITAKVLSEQYHIPFDTTSRVMQLMAGAGILKAEQGPQGGYLIAKDLKNIHFLELAEVILGPVSLADCLGKETRCQLIGTCNILSPVVTMNRKLLELCANTALEELLQSPEGAQEEHIRKQFLANKAIKV